LKSYYRITETILIQHGPRPGWNPVSAPPWYPKHVLAMLSPDPTVELVVCTQATDHTRYPGMILYEVRRLPRRRRRQRTHEVRMVDYWTAYDTFRRALESQLRNGIPEFDPGSPDYVIIVPREFFKDPAIRQLTREIMDPTLDEYFRVQPEISRRRLTIDPRVTQFWLGAVIIAGAAAIVAVSAGAFAPAAAGAGAVRVETTGGGRVR